ncbi:MAG TPA: PrsW family glutamic-type intramembrane protease [Polyangiaceae bacterium]
MIAYLLASLVSLVPLAVAAFAYKKIVGGYVGRRRFVAWAVLAGALLGAVGYHAEAALFAWTELSLSVAETGAGGALLAVFALAAPLEEALKVLVVWPLYLRRVMRSGKEGMLFAFFAGAGFAAGEAMLGVVRSDEVALAAARHLAGGLGHVFFAGVWGFALSRAPRARWFSGIWTVSVLGHGFYQHVVFGRGPAFLVLAPPMLAAMGGIAFFLLRKRSDDADDTERPSLAEPPSLRFVRRAMRPPEQAIALRWVAIGALVTLGAMITLLAAGVYLGHAAGIDFAAAEESDVRAGGPLVLLGTCALAAFPLSGYLVARASAARSIVEAALGAALAIMIVVVMLGISAPTAVVFALAAAPLAFGLACGGGWFGVR